MPVGEYVVSIPANFTDSLQISRLISSVIRPDRTPLSSNIVFDFGRLNWIEGEAITSLSNLLEWLRRRGVKVKLRVPDPRRDGVIYLDDCQFFKQYQGSTIRPFPQVRPTTIPLRLIEQPRSFAWINYEVIPWLAAKLSLNEDAFSDLAGSMYEIFNNIKDHSEEEIGCCFIQFFPKLNTISLNIADFGIGIPSSMRETYPDLTDAKAIERAIEEGVTSKPGGRNLGMGLPTLCQTVVGRNKGQLTISSNYGRLSCTPGNGAMVINALQTGYFYPGTLIKAVLRTDTIEAGDVRRENLEW